MEKNIDKRWKIFKNLKAKLKQVASFGNGWKGATLSISIVALLVFIIQNYYMVASAGFKYFLIALVVSLPIIALTSGIITLLLHLFKKIPSRFVWALLNAFILLVIGFLGFPSVMFTVITIMLLLFSLFGALLYKFIMGDYKNIKSIKKVTFTGLLLVVILSIAFGGYWLLNNGKMETFQANLKEYKTSDKYNTELKNPAQEGLYKVKTLTYRTPNSYRKQLDQSNSLTTTSFDGSAFLEKWSSLRTKYLGFGPDKMPINGMVWYPEGDGPFPLVVVVHGAHLMTDYSDVGYEYLGRHLASHGYIMVSIDENFLNVSPFHDLFIFKTIEKENPARALVLLEHLKTWRTWNQEPNNPFHGKVDMSNIALIGHSRGGEAVSIATAFNKLNAYPENGNIKFNYKFNIRSVIALSTTDQQYKPSDKLLSLKDVNYLAIQGAHDMDVNSFAGSRQYERISFTDGTPYFKASVYISGANHGQFNSVWGGKDGAGMGNRFFNTKQLMPEKDQQKIAKTLITSFLEATLKDKSEYKLIFEDMSYGKDWLPDTTYISNYYDSHTKLISSFEEDMDLFSTTVPGGILEGENFQVWKEEKVDFKYGNTDYSAVHLEWDKTRNPKNAVYKVTLPPSGLDINENSSLVFSMADGDIKNEKGNNLPMDLTIQVMDRNGNVASLPLSYNSYLLPMIEGKILKAPFANFSPTREPVFQYFKFKLMDFHNANPNFNIKELTHINFVFNRTEKGIVLLNNLGIKN